MKEKLYTQYCEAEILEEEVKALKEDEETKDLTEEETAPKEDTYCYETEVEEVNN